MNPRHALIALVVFSWAFMVNARTRTDIVVGSIYDIVSTTDLHDGPGQKYEKKIDQKASDIAFKTVGMFTARSYVDHTPLSQVGVPEERQYQLLAMKDDVVSRQPSPILTVLVS